MASDCKGPTHSVDGLQLVFALSRGLDRVECSAFYRSSMYFDPLFHGIGNGGVSRRSTKGVRSCLREACELRLARGGMFRVLGAASSRQDFGPMRSFVARRA